MSRAFSWATSRAVCLVCGLLSSVQYVAINVIVPMRWTTYSAASQTISELSAAFGRLFRVYSMATLAATLVFGTLTARDAENLELGRPTPWIGVWERISIVVGELDRPRERRLEAHLLGKAALGFIDQENSLCFKTGAWHVHAGELVPDDTFSASLGVTL